MKIIILRNKNGKLELINSAEGEQHREYVRGLLVEQQVIIANVPPADAPVKILGFYIQRKHVREQPSQVAGYFFNRIADNQQLSTARDVCYRHNDVATASLIENWIDDSEKRTWFFAEIAQDL